MRDYDRLKEYVRSNSARYKEHEEFGDYLLNIVLDESSREAMKGPQRSSRRQVIKRAELRCRQERTMTIMESLILTLLLGVIVNLVTKWIIDWWNSRKDVSANKYQQEADLWGKYSELYRQSQEKDPAS